VIAQTTIGTKIMRPNVTRLGILKRVPRLCPPVYSRAVPLAHPPIPT
jgi:hypothetical protein